MTNTGCCRRTAAVDTAERAKTWTRSRSGQRRAPRAEDLEDRLVAEGEIAGDYLEELLDLLDFDGDIDLDVEGDRAIVSIDGGGDLTSWSAARARCSTRCRS